MPAKQTKLSKRKSTTNDSENIQKSTEEICVPNFSKKVKLANKTKAKAVELEESTSEAIPESSHNKRHTDGPSDVLSQGPNLDSCDTPSESHEDTADVKSTVSTSNDSPLPIVTLDAGDSDSKKDAPAFTENKDEHKIGDKSDETNIDPALKTNEGIEFKDAVKKDVELEGKPCSSIKSGTTAADAVLPNTKEDTSSHEDVSISSISVGGQQISNESADSSRSISGTDAAADGLLQTNIAEETHQINADVDMLPISTAEVTPNSMKTGVITSKESYDVVRSSSPIKVSVKETSQGEIQVMDLETDDKESIETPSNDNSSDVGSTAVHAGEANVKEATESAVSTLIEDVLPKSAIIDTEVASDVIDTSAPSSTTAAYGNSDRADYNFLMSKQASESPTITEAKEKVNRQFIIQDGRKIYAIEGGIDTMVSPTIAANKPKDNRDFIIQDGRKIYAIEGGIDTMVSPKITVDKPKDNRDFFIQDGRKIYAIEGGIDTMVSSIITANKPKDNRDFIIQDGRKIYAIEGGIDTMDREFLMQDGKKIYAIEGDIDTDENLLHAYHQQTRVIRKRHIPLVNIKIYPPGNVIAPINSDVTAQMVKNPTPAEFDDIGLSDSQLCAMEWQQPGSNIRFSNTSHLVERKSRPKPIEPKDSTSIVRAVVLEMASLNKMILKTKREVEAMRKKVQQPTTHLPHQRNTGRKSII